jgi:hypothetical protein
VEVKSFYSFLANGKNFEVRVRCGMNDSLEFVEVVVNDRSATQVETDYGTIWCLS